jgi:mono/diheme cytochrome c family protein
MTLAVTVAGDLRAAAPRADTMLADEGSFQRLFAAAGGSPDVIAPQRLLTQYCVTCHNQRARTGGLALDTRSLANVGADAEIWEKVVVKLRAGLMPPAGRPRPDAASYDAFATWLENELDRAAHENPDPGSKARFHRLNRAEYQNAIRDLLALHIDVTSMLPPDDASYGFDNSAGVLRMSPTLMERYLAAAEKVSRRAVGSPTIAADTEVYRLPDDLSQERHIDGPPFGTRGGTLIRHTFPVDGEYVVKVRLARDFEEYVPVHWRPGRTWRRRTWYCAANCP